MQQIANLSLKLCLSQVAFNNFYNAASTADKCTMYSDRNLINRRNVKSDVSSAANPCRRFFQLEVEARIIGAAVKVILPKLGTEQITERFISKYFVYGYYYVPKRIRVQGYGRDLWEGHPP